MHILKNASHKVLLFILSLIALMIINDPYYHRITDLQEDYFYKALLFKEYYNPQLNYILTHPGIPQIWELSLIMWLVRDPIEESVTIFYIAYLINIIVNSLAIILLSNAVKNNSLKLPVISLVLLWPPFWYYLTCYGADSYVIAFSICIISITWEFLGNEYIKYKTLKLLLLIHLSTLALATKISLLMIIIPCLMVLFLKIFREKKDRKDLYLLLLLTLYMYLFVKYAFKGIILILIKWYAGGNAEYLKFNFPSILDFNPLYLFFGGGAFAFILINTLKCKFKLKGGSLNLNYYKNILIILLILISLKAISLGGGFDPKASRNASPFIPVLCFALIAINDSISFNIKAKVILSGMLTKNLLLISIFYLAITCSLYNGNYRVKQLTAFINSDVDLPNLSKNEEAKFHLVGNEVYGQNKFFTSVVKKFSE